MAKKIWNNPIDKSIDWSGDPIKTEGLPVSGEMVQRFIKESLDSKAGLFYYDTTNNRYIVFTDEVAKNEYVNDPTRTDLIIGTFDAPFNYTAEISLVTPVYNAIYLGDTGNYLDFTFDVKNKQGASTGESVVITYTFIRNATKQVHSQVARNGENIHFNIDKYLGEGTNTVIIGISGQTTLAATTVAVTYNVVNLQLTDEADISTVYDLSSGPKTMEINFTVEGSGTKIVEWYLDGVMIPFVKAEDEVVDISAERTKYITLSNLQQGRHSLQLRAYTTINGERFYTQTNYRDIIVYTGVNNSAITAIAMEVPAKYGIITGNPIIYGITQYTPYTLKFATYSPGNKTVNVVVKLDEESLGSVSSQNGIVNEFSIVSKTQGSKTISLVGEEISYDIPTVVAKTSMAIEEITSGLKIDFSSIGRSNNSEDRDLWEQGEYVGTFKGFEWNVGSGWVNNRLKINAGASFGINYAPLANNPKVLGRTLEFEFKTVNVSDDNAVICDLRDSSGTGILITATKVSVISENGVKIENEFKTNENVRIGIVINRASGAVRKCMTFIYANGSISRGINWATDDNYTSDAQILFKGSSGAEVELKAIRIYEAALSDDNMLNNYIIYRDSVSEMTEVYDRNDVYAEGTTTFSPDKMVSRLPVMIVTGDIPILENTSDTNTQIIVDIEYTNMQDPSKSFKMTGAAMRPQGTSSMGYPKKNFRIYTNKVANTILYNSQGNIVEDKLYSFKDGAIPVDCWCLKADYAESSGTHNTGIARMWNKALYDMQINGEYVCRTDAQKAAIEAGYPYDVRTTIDGFPILLFYKKNATDEPIFIGKYNFNNDKSTEKVFGFTDIPGFDNSKMQCWEILNNGNPLALFQTINGFDTGWDKAYESRYPDTKTPYTGDLKAFSQWMVGVNGDSERFATEKWEHLKIYPMAAYYCYIMRHAAADQLVKNAMFTSEDGIKFYFIQYDNDTINGLINTGDIDILPTDDRQSKDESGEYKFAGHGSVLWNMLEADEEFMTIVKEVDNALYSAGISYNECIKVFDEEQADKWVERVYNQDSEYKYIGPYINQGIDNLFMLQGKRDLHRKWWLSKRFSIYDAKFVSGEYKSQAVELKCMNNTPAGQQFSIRAGYPLDYGYGINNVPRKSGITLDIGDYYTFTTTEDVNLGDPIRIYGAPNIKELDLSPIANRLAVVNIASVYTESLGTRLKKFILGGADINNIEVPEISGLKQAKMLTHLDVRGMRGIKSIDLSSQPYFEELKAIGSEIASVSFAKGAPVNRLELPTTMKAITLEQLPYLTADNLIFENIVGIHSINIKGCPNLTNNFNWIKNWYNSKATVDSKCSLVMDNVIWTDVDPNDLANLTKLGNLDLKGKVILNEITLEQYKILLDAFGESAFDKNSNFSIDASSTILVNGRTTITEGESEEYDVVVFGTEVLRMSWSIASGNNSFVTLSNNGVLSVAEGYGTGTIVIRTSVVTNEELKIVETTVSVNALVYPTSLDTTIEGSKILKDEYEVFQLSYPDSVTGEIASVWSLEGLGGYAIIHSQDNNSCTIKKLQEALVLESGTLTCMISKKSTSESLFTLSRTVEVVNDTIAETDEGICAALYNAGLCANKTYITKDEAAVIIESDLMKSDTTSIFYPYKSQIKSFKGFKFFESIRAIPESCFSQCNLLENISIPTAVVEFGPYAFDRCKKLSSIEIPETVKILGKYCFADSGLSSIVIPDSVTSIGEACFWKCSSLKSVRLPNSISSLEKNCFSTSGLLSIDIPSNIKTIGDYCFASNYDLSSVTFHEGLEVLGKYCFNGAFDLKSVELPEGILMLGEKCFYGSNISSINLPNSLTSLGNGCLEQTDIESVVIPSSIKSLPQNCFLDCYYLTTVELPYEIESIGSYCFARCRELNKIICSAPVAPTIQSNTFEYDDDYAGSNVEGDKTLIIPSNALYYNTGYWLNSLLNSSKCGFTLSESLPEVEVPDVAEIDEGVCKSLYSKGLCKHENYITKSEAALITNTDLSTINDGSVFYDYRTKIKSFDGFKYFTGVTSLDSSVFFDVNNMTSIELPTTLTNLGAQTFMRCKSLNFIKVPSEVKTIGYQCFRECEKIWSIELPSSLLSIGGQCFSGCKSLSTILSLATKAPKVESDTFGNTTTDASGQPIYSYYTGRNTYDTGSNVLTVPSGATGYDTGYWLNPLQNTELCGFTLNATL